jgi:hypothetical protein
MVVTSPDYVKSKYKLHMIKEVRPREQYVLAVN